MGTVVPSGRTIEQFIRGFFSSFLSQSVCCSAPRGVEVQDVALKFLTNCETFECCDSSVASSTQDRSNEESAEFARKNASRIFTPTVPLFYFQRLIISVDF